MTVVRMLGRLTASLILTLSLTSLAFANDRADAGRTETGVSMVPSVHAPPAQVGPLTDTATLGGAVPWATIAPPPAWGAPGGSGATLVQGGGGGTPQLRYYALDGLGSVRVVFDAAGAVVSRADYEPFGAAVATSTTGTLPRQQFTGQERDGEVGVDYFGARLYVPPHGRMPSVDPLYVGAVAEPQRWNRYAYALNSPVVYTDPDGRAAHECGQYKLAVDDGSGVFRVSVTCRDETSGGSGGGGQWAAVLQWLQDRLNAPVGGVEADEWHGPSRWLSRPRVTDRDGVNGPEATGNVSEGFDPLVEGITVVATVGGSAGNSLAKLAVREGGQAIARKASATVPRFVSAPSGTVDLKSALERIGSGALDPHRRDGTIHRNLEGLLPRGNQYTEWVVRGSVDAPTGTNRIVIGSNGSIYFSYDHYGSFTQLAGPR